MTRLAVVFGVALAGWALAAFGDPQAARNEMRAVSSPPSSTVASQSRSAAADSEFPLGTATPSEECGACHQAIYREFACGFGADLKFKGMVDHNAGKVAKTEAITSGEDLSAAKTQNEAMTKAKQSLHATLAKVLKANPGFRAVSIFPALKDGHPVAEITLTKGGEWKTVSETLD
jgi:hypothetical protein